MAFKYFLYYAFADYYSTKPCNTHTTQGIQLFSSVATWIFLPGPSSWLNSSLKVSELVPTSPMSWWTAICSWEELAFWAGLQLNVCFRKVVKNDLKFYPGCLETSSGQSSVVIHRDPPFLTPWMGLAFYRRLAVYRAILNTDTPHSYWLRTSLMF